MIKALILDLDNTIFPTRTLDRDQVKPFFDALAYHNDSLSDEQLKAAIEAMWKKPIHVVAEEFGFSESMYHNSMKSLEGRNFQFNIEPYEDYHYLLKLEIPLFLVTTGSTELQKAKIASLKIAEHFVEIFIDDPMIHSGGKTKIFRELMKKHRYSPADLLVIGDNPESEIKAAEECGIPALVIDRSGKKPGNPSSMISSFREIQLYTK